MNTSQIISLTLLILVILTLILTITKKDKSLYYTLLFGVFMFDLGFILAIENP